MLIWTPGNVHFWHQALSTGHEDNSDIYWGIHLRLIFSEWPLLGLYLEITPPFLPVYPSWFFFIFISCTFEEIWSLLKSFLITYLLLLKVNSIKRVLFVCFLLRLCPSALEQYLSLSGYLINIFWMIWAPPLLWVLCKVLYILINKCMK